MKINLKIWYECRSSSLVLQCCEKTPKRQRYGYLVFVIYMELDLVVFAQHRAFQLAVRQVVREEQLSENHVVLKHVRVLNRDRQKKQNS